MSKLSFRARALDAWKTMPIYMSEELPDLPEYSAINRAVPQMPSGMKKEEEWEHHLQRAIVAGLFIPIPEVVGLSEVDYGAYNRIYSPDYKVPRQLIHMQPFAMEQDIPNYDMDSEDEIWVNAQVKTLDITPLKFEEMMDRLEENSGHSVVTQSEAKMLLKEDDDLIIAVYDYWLNKRLKTQQPLIPTVRTEAHRTMNCKNNPYVAFQRRTEKMQTRKNRKNDEASYEKMIKLQRDLRRALTLLEFVKRRENSKRELLHLTIEVFEKRYQAGDWLGQLLNEATAVKHSRPAFAPLFSNQFGVGQTTNWVNKQAKAMTYKEDLIQRKEKRQYKKRKHKILGNIVSLRDNSGLSSSNDDVVPSVLSISSTKSPADEALFTFKRSKLSTYWPPVNNTLNPWLAKDDKKNLQCHQFHPIFITTPRSRTVISGRGRYGRGGRLLIDRGFPPGSPDDFWETCDFKIQDSQGNPPRPQPGTEITTEGLKIFQPKMSPKNVPLVSILVDGQSERVNGENQVVIQLEDVTSAEEMAPIQMNTSLSLPEAGACDGNSLELELESLCFEVNLNNSSVDLSTQQDLLDDGFTASLESKSPKLRRSSSDLSPDLLSLNVKDLLGSSGLFLDSPDSVITNSTMDACISPVKKDRIEQNSLGNDKFENSGSLLDRWAKFESGMDINQIKKCNNQLGGSFTPDDLIGHSAFKTINSSLNLKKNHCHLKRDDNDGVSGVSGSLNEFTNNTKDIVIANKYSAAADKSPHINSIQPVEFSTSREC